MSPVVNDELVTAADNLEHQCPKCQKYFRDFILFICPECQKKGWYEIVLNKDWFSKKLPDGSPDWNSVKKDKKVLDNHWSYGRLNTKTLEMERVPIDRDGRAWDYLTDLKDEEAEKNAIKDADAYSNTLREISYNRAKSAREVKQEVKHKQKMENAFIKVEKREQKEETNEQV